MSALLTTGEMIDKLKIGEWAVSEGIGYIKVTKTADGRIQHDCGGDLVLGKRVSTRLWDILPKYTTFQETMEALSEGKTVYFHGIDGNGAKIKVNADELGYKLLFHRIGERSLHDLYYGKWSIEE